MGRASYAVTSALTGVAFFCLVTFDRLGRRLLAVGSVGVVVGGIRLAAFATRKRKARWWGPAHLVVPLDRLQLGSQRAVVYRRSFDPDSHRRIVAAPADRPTHTALKAGATKRHDQGARDPYRVGRLPTPCGRHRRYRTGRPGRSAGSPLGANPHAGSTESTSVSPILKHLTDGRPGPEPSRAEVGRTDPLSDPTRRYGALVAVVGTLLSLCLLPTLFLTIFGLMGLVVFAPGGWAALTKRPARLERLRYAVACLGAIAVLSAFLYGFATGSVNSTSWAGRAFWIAVVTALLLASLFSLVRLVARQR